MQGYWNDPVRTEDAIEAGWMKTGGNRVCVMCIGRVLRILLFVGDLAVMDKEGYGKE